ncbi:MAG: [FeFe] hydrogenase H-cluster radical SAM maturase HydE [Defluviitaleaceae bacterium]|nr:[FeFe] hydrogenase H-cluster radical SAM maturase HydE [Defluviitaleaceae bacterium]
MQDLIHKLESTNNLQRSEYKSLLLCDDKYLHERASTTREKIFGNKIYMRGLIEFTNYCKCDCYYCGLRHSNKTVQRYRYTKEQILECCAHGHELGFRTFVLQGGEDSFFTDEILVDIIQSIKTGYPDCAITISLGERSLESLKLLRVAGADRYLLRQETSSANHYSQLHPPNMNLKSRQDCLWNLKSLGFQVGCGFMVGTPGQTLDHIVDDFLFIKELDPAMVGIGPFIPHSETPFAGEKRGNLALTLNIVAILRLMKPNLLLPSTTALGNIHPKGREMGVLAGANVVMPNLSSPETQGKYQLYDNKSHIGDKPAQFRDRIAKQMAAIGCEVVVSRGDYAE